MASKNDLFKKKGPHEGFEEEDDDDASDVEDEKQRCKNGKCAKKKKTIETGDEPDEVVPPPPPKNVITEKESTVVMDLQQIKDDVAQIKDILMKQERLKPPPPAFETFYSMNYY